MSTRLADDGYYDTMYVQIKERAPIWRCITEYITKDVGKINTVVELGAGYCDFINAFSAKKKYAVDISPIGQKYAHKDVSFHVSTCTKLSFLKSASVDLVFASNLFEHLTSDELIKTMGEIKRILRRNGQLILIQPNFAIAYKEYFHDYTHKTIFTHIGISDFLENQGFVVTKLLPKFLPFSMQKKYSGKSIPKFVFFKPLIRFYLHFPIKPFARQMYVVCHKK